MAMTLPIDFARENNIGPGTELFVVKNRKSFVITTSEELARELEEPIHQAAERVVKKTREMDGGRP